MQLAMMQNVQGAAPVQWPNPTALTPVVPTPAAAPARHEHPALRVEGLAPQNAYETMRMQAFRRDAAETASLSTMAPSTTATASTAIAPAVKGAPAPMVPLTPVPDAPARAAVPQAPPPIQAPTAVDTGSSTSATRR